MDLLELTQKIFYDQPLKKNSIQLEFCEMDNPNNMSVEDIFKNLLMIFTEGMKILFADENERVNLSSLSADDFALVNKYFNSFGINISYKVISLSADNFALPNKNKLKDFFLRLKTEEKVYIISFDYII